MQEAVLLHPKKRTAYVYNASLPEALQIPDAGEVRSAVLEGFVIDCSPIWEELA